MARSDARAAYDNLRKPRILVHGGQRTYWPFTIDEIMHLCALCEKHISASSTTTVKMSMVKEPEIHFENGFISAAFLRVDGSYFKDREAISFNGDGFIGFCGWASSRNERPFIDAFIEWTEWLDMTHGRYGVCR